MAHEGLVEKLGLSGQEAKVYIAALELGKCLPKHLAEKAGVKRPTLYQILPKLIREGFLAETIVGKRRYFIPEDPQIFLDKKKAELSQLEELMPELRLLLTASVSKPKISFYEGVEGIKKVTWDSMHSKETIREFIGLHKIHPEMEEYHRDFYIPERIRRRKQIQIIISGPPKYGTIKLDTDPDASRKIKVIDGKKYPIPMDCYVYDDSISFLVFRADSEPVAVLLRSKEISTMLKSLHKYMWGSIK